MRTGILKCAAVPAAVAVMQLGLGGPARAATGTTLSEKYVGNASFFNPARCGGCGVDYPAGLCREGAGEPFNPTRKNVGRVCFTGLTSPGTYKVTVIDVSGQDLGFTYLWKEKGTRWDESRAQPACKTVTLKKPSRTSQLTILLGEPFIGPGHGQQLHGYPIPGGRAPIYCHRKRLPNTPSVPTTGEVTLTTPAR